MTAWEVIQEASGLSVMDRRRKPLELVIKPGVSAAQISAFEADLGFSLPVELADLLSRCGGVDGPRDMEIDFKGRIKDFALEEVFPRCVPIADDRCGNFWVLDASPEGAAVAPVFFACHDPPVVLYQSPDLATFLAEVFRRLRPPNGSLVDDVCDDRLFHVSSRNPGAMTLAEAANADPVLQDFAASLDERFRIVDLREPEIGMGFPWCRYGPRTDVRR